MHRHTPAAPRPATSAEIRARAADLLKAVADPERLWLLERLAVGEVCVSELCEASGASMPTVSHRLRALRAAGLVDRRREGRHVYYTVRDRHVVALVEAALVHAAELADAAPDAEG